MRTIVRLALAVGLVTGTGCSSQPKLVPVSGLVKLDGKPVEGVRVYFWPTQATTSGSYSSRFAIGFSGPDGRYKLSSTYGDGIESGEYKVTFARPVARATRATVEAGKKPDEAGAVESLPSDLTDVKKTKHGATVSETNREFNFDLSSK